MKKGISAIIATILLLLITIALAGSAYVYVSGMLTGKTAKTISVLDASCTGSTITVVVSNDGTTNITTSEIKFFVGNAEDTTVTWNPNQPLAPHTTAVITDITGTSGQANTVLIVSPSNAVREVVYC